MIECNSEFGNTTCRVLKLMTEMIKEISERLRRDAKEESGDHSGVLEGSVEVLQGTRKSSGGVKGRQAKVRGHSRPNLGDSSVPFNSQPELGSMNLRGEPLKLDDSPKKNPICIPPPRWAHRNSPRFTAVHRSESPPLSTAVERGGSTAMDK